MDTLQEPQHSLPSDQSYRNTGSMGRKTAFCRPTGQATNSNFFLLFRRLQIHQGPCLLHHYGLPTTTLKLNKSIMIKPPQNL